MANDISERPWVIDTPGATLLWEANVKIAYIKWHRPTTINHTFQIQNINSKVVLEGEAEAALGSQVYLINDWWHGLKVPTLASGILYIYIN